jgi:hypothetical protein
VAPAVGSKIATEKGIKRKQEEGLLAGPEAGAGRPPPQAAPKQSALNGSHFKPPPLVEVLTRSFAREDQLFADSRKD